MITTWKSIRPLSRAMSKVRNWGDWGGILFLCGRYFDASRKAWLPVADQSITTCLVDFLHVPSPHDCRSDHRSNEGGC